MPLGGKTVKRSDARFNELAAKIAVDLNLCPHLTGPVENPVELLFAVSGRFLVACFVDCCFKADVEGHLGTDGRYYVLDTARTFPCEPPTKDRAQAIRRCRKLLFFCLNLFIGTSGHLVRLLRAEMVKANPVALCSDAFSNFQKADPNRLKHNAEVIIKRKKLVLSVKGQIEGRKLLCPIGNASFPSLSRSFAA